MQGQRGTVESFSKTLGFEPPSSDGEPPLSGGEPPVSVFSLSDNNGHHGSLLPLGSCPEFVPHNFTLNPSTSIGFKSSSSLEPYRASTSSSSAFSEPLDDRHLSRKRKATELTVGPSSSGIGSSDMFEAIPENPLGFDSTNSDDIIPRLGLSLDRASSQNPFVENGPRNVHPRIDSSRQQDPLPALYPSLRLNPVDFRSPPLTATPENSSSHQGQPVQPVRIPALRRNFQTTSRWSRNSSLRPNRPTFNLGISGDQNEPDSISGHPLFGLSSTVQTELNWNSNSVVAASSRAGPSSRPTPSPATPTAPHRISQHYNPRRVSAFLRRTSSATDLEAGGGPNGNLGPRIPPPVSTSALGSQDVGIPHVVGIQGLLHQPHSRSSVLLGRQLEGAFGFPHLSRSAASGTEGRGRLVSEIRNVLDLMRRGEPLRFEDLMILDQSVFYGIADIHDRHRDMRLDINNMSYEELLALEERIGNVNTGLTEEVISKHLKPKQYVTETGQPYPEPCCICQEEYNDGDDLGTLECGHEFHLGCIKQWLQQKNLCPFCKSSTGFTAT